MSPCLCDVLQSTLQGVNTSVVVMQLFAAFCLQKAVWK